MRLLRPAAALVATVLSLAATAIPASALVHGNTTSDLGINTRGVPLNGPAVSAFLANLAPETTSIILSSCAHYVTTPNSARSQDTLDFCRVALGDAAAGNVRTFGATQPSFLESVAPRAPRAAAPYSNSNCQFPHYTVDPSDPCY
jgi:hypothetical protein